MVVLFWSLIIFIVICNIYVACTKTEDEMLTEFVFEQGKFGSICTNAFYILAWILKAMESFIKIKLKSRREKQK